MRTRTMTWAAALCLALLAASCQSEEEAGRRTACFTSAAPTHRSPMHRTAMNQYGTFYWTQGDYIFVKNGTTYVRSNNAASGLQPAENFYLDGVFEDQPYDVLYTGNGSNRTPNSVTIRAQQTQALPNDASHIGADGDCGKARATHNGTGIYTFQLDHLASYLNIMPQKEHDDGRTMVLTSITVQTSGADNLCGTYTFGENTLNLRDEDNSAPGKQVALTVGSFEVPLKDDVDNGRATLDQARAFVVIQPGMHTLTITYTDSQGNSYAKNVPQHEFLPGHFTNVRHKLGTPSAP